MTEPGAASRLRVVSMNLWGIRGDWEARRSVLRAGIAALRPDVVTFQEVIRTSEYDQARDLLGPDFHIHQQIRREPDGQALSIASRWPIECATLVATTEVPRRTRRLYARHLPL